jgi:hypothetical protein
LYTGKSLSVRCLTFQKKENRYSSKQRHTPKQPGFSLADHSTNNNIQATKKIDKTNQKNASIAKNTTFYGPPLVALCAIFIISLNLY